jgi:ribonuclease R
VAWCEPKWRNGVVKINQPAGFPTREQILDFIEKSDVPAGKREIARAFHLRGAEKVALKALLKDMTDEGLVDLAPGRAFHKMGGVPKVTVLRITGFDGNEALAVPDRWEAENSPPPLLRVKQVGRRAALAIGDRILARTEAAGQGHIAHVMKRLAAGSELMLGVVEKDERGRFWLKPVDKKIRRSTPISDLGQARVGQLVEAEHSGRPPRVTARVIKIIGDPFEAKSFSLIAIAKFDIPNLFDDRTLAEAQLVTDLPLTTDKREDLRALPIVAIDPVDARDFDDAIWAQADENPDNPGGFQALVAIADVSYYVRPDSALDREAVKRGNSVYFPDRVVPMLPEALSADKCSLRAGEDRAALACHLTIDEGGKVTAFRFTRALVRIAANIPYEQAQAAIDAGTGHDMLDVALKPLWACWALLAKARDKREPLDLDLPEKKVVLDDTGKIVEIGVRERLDAHRVVEDFMIAANVAAAKALEAKKSPLIYRVHQTPSREKLVALKEYLKQFDMEFALGQVISPATFNRLIDRITDDTVRPQIMEQILRSQTQAYYHPDNLGHFGLNLGSYAHFTSPIRRYSDLIVHRALVSAYGLEQPAPRHVEIPRKSGLSEQNIARIEQIAEAISGTERRAMLAERETLDRYIAHHLSGMVGQVLECRITGVQGFGFFATVEGLGGDGLVPASTLGAEYFAYDESSQTLTGQSSGDSYHIGQRLPLRLIHADPVSGGLMFELPDGTNHMPMARGRVERKGGKPGKFKTGKRGRPANIRHKGR